MVDRLETLLAETQGNARTSDTARQKSGGRKEVKWWMGWDGMGGWRDVRGGGVCCVVRW